MRSFLLLFFLFLFFRVFLRLSYLEKVTVYKGSLNIFKSNSWLKNHFVFVLLLLYILLYHETIILWTSSDLMADGGLHAFTTGWDDSLARCTGYFEFNGFQRMAFKLFPKPTVKKPLNWNSSYSSPPHPPYMYLKLIFNVRTDSSVCCLKITWGMRSWAGIIVCFKCKLRLTAVQKY